MTMNNKSIKPIISQKEIKTEVKKLGKQISSDFKGRDLVIISVLKSSVYFLTDLSRSISIPVKIDFLEIERIPNTEADSGIVKITRDLNLSLSDKDVLLLDVIINTGLTHGYLLQNLKSRRPASINICTLLNNPANRLVELPISYYGFEISDVFVVGYGLDDNEKYRQLPFIGKKKEND